MPRYEYLCIDCGATTEVRATLAEKQAGLTVACHRCAGADLRRAFSPLARVGGDRPVPVATGGPAPTGGCCGGGCCA